MTFEINLNVQAQTAEELLHQLRDLHLDVLSWFQTQPHGAHRKQTCTRCHREQRFEFSLHNEIWAMLPEEWQNSVLCIECFLEIMDDTLTDILELTPDDFYFVGAVCRKVLCIFLESPDLADILEAQAR